MISKILKRNISLFLSLVMILSVFSPLTSLASSEGFQKGETVLENVYNQEYSDDTLEILQGKEVEETDTKLEYEKELEIELSNTILKLGEEIDLNLIYRGEYLKDLDEGIIWELNEPNSLKIDTENNKIIPKKSGTFILTAVSSKSQEVSSEIEIKVEPFITSLRIEGNNRTIVPLKEVEVTSLDLTSYGIKTEFETVKPIHVIIKGLESEGIDCKDSENGLNHSAGSFIRAIDGLSQGSVGDGDGWMYYVDNTYADRGVNVFDIEEEQTVVVFFQEDWQNITYTWFEEEKVETEIGEEIIITLMGSSYNMMTDATVVEPLENAFILVENERLIIDGEEIKTDSNGQAIISFKEAGKYKISAERFSGKTRDISRPYKEVVIFENVEDIPFSINIEGIENPSYYSDVEIQINIEGNNDKEVEIEVKLNGEIIEPNDDLSYLVKLDEGINILEAIATDKEGNEVKDRKIVNYSQIKVVEFMPAPGQFTNTSWTDASRLRSIPDGGISLGAYGGYVILEFENPVKNDPMNPYGVDFTIFGNPFEIEGKEDIYNQEPGIVEVSKSLDGPWYVLAGSEHYREDTYLNYEVTYKNPKKEVAADVAWTDNKGNTGYVRKTIYNNPLYPNIQDFPLISQEEYSLRGVSILNDVDANDIGTERYQVGFGYADCTPTASRANFHGMPNNPYKKGIQGYGGDGMDLRWAVDREGNPVEVDEIKYVKIYTGSLKHTSSFGEISTEITGMRPSTPIINEVRELEIQGDEELKEGQQAQFYIKAFDQLGKETVPSQINWSISDETIASIHPAAGLVTARKQGITEVTASLATDETVKATIQIYVGENIEKKPTRMHIINETGNNSILEGGNTRLAPLIYDQFGNLMEELSEKVEWTSSDDSIATAERWWLRESAGEVKGKKAGYVTIKGQYEDLEGETIIRVLDKELAVRADHNRLINSNNLDKAISNGKESDMKEVYLQVINTDRNRSGDKLRIPLTSLLYAQEEEVSLVIEAKDYAVKICPKTFDLSSYSDGIGYEMVFETALLKEEVFLDNKDMLFISGLDFSFNIEEDREVIEEINQFSSLKGIEWKHKFMAHEVSEKDKDKLQVLIHDENGNLKALEKKYNAEIMQMTFNSHKPQKWIVVYGEKQELPMLPVEKELLKSAIVEAEENKASVKVSLDGRDIDPLDKWVTQENIDTYKKAIADAQNILENDEVTQEEVDAAVTALATATDNFNNEKKAGIKAEEKDKLEVSIAKLLGHYNSNLPESPSGEWETFVGLRGLNSDITSSPQSYEWINKDPGFAKDTRQNDHIYYIFSLLGLGENPSEAFDSNRNLFSELASQQNLETGSFGPLGKHIWSIVALDIGSDMGLDVGIWNGENRSKAINHLIKQQNQDGSFASFSKIDHTGWSLIPLSKSDGQDIDNSIKKAKEYLKSMQQDSGGFGGTGWDRENLNSISAAVQGLVAVGEDITSSDGPWSKNGKTPVDALLSYQNEDGTFNWQHGNSGSIGMATKQASVALSDIYNGKSTWYMLGEDISFPEKPETIRVELKVDGISENILPEKAITISLEDKEKVTALDVIKIALDQGKISYEVEESSWGPYIKSIDGQVAGSLGGWDGWMYQVNGESPEVGVASYEVKEDDILYVYYSRWPALSSTERIQHGAENPSIKISLAGDTFTGKEEVESLENWDIKTGNTNLKVERIEKLDDQKVAIYFQGKSRGGRISILPEANILTSENQTGITLEIVREIKSDENILKINEEKEVIIRHSEDQDLKREIKLEFESEKLPIVEVMRGRTTLKIPENTSIEGDWDRKLQIPTELDVEENKEKLKEKIGSSLNSNGKEADQIGRIIKVGGSESISFNQHVNLIFKGEGKSQAAFIDHSGGFNPIRKYDDAAEREDDVYAYAEGDDLVVKTRHFTEFLSYTVKEKDNSGGQDKPDDGSQGGTGGGSVTPKPNQRVTLSVEKKTYDGSDFISRTSLDLREGDTAYSLLKREAGKRGISVSTTGSGNTVYVYSIGGLSEFDGGPESGWMYSVNGVFPDKSAGSYLLSDGDVLRWQYTKNLGKDIGGESVADSGGSSQGASKKEDENKKVEEAKEYYELNKNIDSASKWILKNRDFSVYDSFNDWDAIALVRSGKTVPEAYYRTLEKHIIDNQGEFRLVTDYQRMVLALSAIGKDPTNVAGYNLVEKIYNNPNMTRQGTNGAVYALIALDAKDYKVDENALWTREKLVDWILDQQNSDGGFPLSKSSGGASDIDVTAMAIQGLARYQDQERVKDSIDKALNWLSKQQTKDGGFSSSESVSQLIIALSTLGIDIEDPRFVKSEANLMTNLQGFINQDGGIAHTKGKESNHIATQQGLMAFAAYNRYLEAGKGLYNMADTDKKSDLSNGNIFVDSDQISSWALEYVEKAYEYGLMTGVSKEDLRFDPSRNITRAEFTTLVVRLFDEDNIDSPITSFKDVNTDAWYYQDVMTARKKGWVSGVAEDLFAPNQSINREQIATILSRILELETKDGLRKPQDINTASNWAQDHILAVYQNQIMIGDGENFNPNTSVTREMAAVIVVRIYESFIK